MKSRSEAGQHTQGFTLVELLMVLVLLGLMGVLTLPMLDDTLTSAKLKATARELATALRSAGGAAVRSRQETLFLLNLDEKRYAVEAAGMAATLDPRFDLALLTAADKKISEGEGGIRFFPDGSATGGRIVVSMDDDRFEIGVDWLTGRVEVLD